MLLPHYYTHATIDLTQHTIGIIFRGRICNLRYEKEVLSPVWVDDVTWE